MSLRDWAVAALVLTLPVVHAGCGSAEENAREKLRTEIEALLASPLRSFLWNVRDRDSLFRQLVSLYERREYAPLWVSPSGLTERGRVVLDALHRAPEHGLSAEYYLRGILTEGDEAGARTGTQALFDVSLSFTTMRYVKDVHEGRFNPRELGLGLDVSHHHTELADEIEALWRSDDLEAALDALEPHYPAYGKLKAALAYYRKLALEEPWQPLRAARTVHPGERYDDIDALRRRLHATGDLPDDVVSEGPVYEPALVTAVKRFQWRLTSMLHLWERFPTLDPF